jgi:hypothetical protein
LAISKLKWLKGRRDVRVFEWKPINIYNSQENVNKTKPRNKPLPKAKEKYLEAFEDIERALQVLDIKYENYFSLNQLSIGVLTFI